MGNVVRMDEFAAARNPARIAVPAFRRYRLLDLARMFAIDGLERRTQIDHLRKLAKLDGLPLPLNQRIRRGVVLRGADAICAASEWDAAAIDAYRNRPDPAAPAARSASPQAGAGMRAQLAQNAARLMAVGGGRG